MAEILGVVASGAGIASLAVQIIENVQKIKSFSDAVKDAPAQMEWMIAEL